MITRRLLTVSAILFLDHRVELAVAIRKAVDRYVECSEQRNIEVGQGYVLVVEHVKRSVL